ncbi:MAG: hypothetical protein GX156_04445 [Bacteroidales bacterium]|nr:hypothetical protein [Bacteroidales bacterium]
MGTDQIYEIAGFKVKIVWDLPDGQKFELPGFAPFLSKKLSGSEDGTGVGSEVAFRNDAHKVLPLNETEDVRFEIVSLEEMQRTPVAKYEQDIEQDMENEMEKDVWGFDIDNGRCVLSKQDNFYWLRIFDTKGILSLQMEMERGHPGIRTGCRLIHMKRVGTVDKNLSGSIAGTVMVPDPDHLRFALWMGMAFAVIPGMAAPVHASVIIHQGQAVVFLGESGTGKSTHTRLWLHNISGCSLLNDDSPILRFHQPEKAIYIYGSPWSGKGRAYHAEGYPVAAIVRLEQAPANKTHRLNIIKSFAALYPSFPPAYLRDEWLQEAICALISEVLKRVPVFRLECLPDVSAAILIHKKIFGEPTEEALQELPQEPTEEPTKEPPQEAPQEPTEDPPQEAPQEPTEEAKQKIRENLPGILKQDKNEA